MIPRRTISGLQRAGIVLRSLLFNIVFYLQLLVVLIVLAPLCLLLSERACMAAAGGWARRSLWLLEAICRTRVEFRGLENLPGRPFILAAKHQSFLEAFAFLTIVPNAAFIMKRELAYVPLWGWFAWRAGMIFVTRGARSRAIDQITRGTLRTLAKGRSLVISPEGSRRAPGAEPRYKYGIVHLHRELPDVPIVPVALNSGLYWPRRGLWRYPGTIVISCLPPVDGAADAGFLDRLAGSIEAECDRLLIEAARASERPPFPREAAMRLAALERQAAVGRSANSDPL